MTNTEKGLIYESLSKDVIENYLDNICEIGVDEILHNETLKGISGATHQIDILVKRNNDKIIIIECKDYSSNVSKDKIQSFISVRNDLQGTYNIEDAYFFVTSDFQIGAKLIGEYNNIKMEVLKKYEKSEFSDRFTTISVSIASEVSNVISIKAFDVNGILITDNYKDLVHNEDRGYLNLIQFASIFIKRDPEKTRDTYSLICNDEEGIHLISGLQVYKIEVEVEFLKGEIRTESKFDVSKGTEYVLIDNTNNKITFMHKGLGKMERELTPPTKKKH